MSLFKNIPPHPFSNSKKLVQYVKNNISIDKVPGFRYFKEYDCIYFLNSKEKICDHKNINHKLSVYYGAGPFKNIVGVLIKQVNKIVDGGIHECKSKKSKGIALTEENINNILNSLQKKYKDKEFKPDVFYNVDGDQLEIYLKNNSYVGRYISPYVTIFKMIDENTGTDLDKFIGVEIGGIKRMLGNEK